jgi:hypothetical protein
MLPGDTLTRDGCLAFLGSRIPGFHVGGKTALDWRGFRHFVAVRPILALWGEAPARLPSWLTERFPCLYQATRLFDSKLESQAGLRPLPEGRRDVLVSVPERALLELLSDVGKGQSLEEARLIAESLHSLREKVLDELLSHVIRIKVVRLAAQLSGDFEFRWAALAKRHSERIGGGKRWVAVSRSGERLDLKRP